LGIGDKGFQLDRVAKRENIDLVFVGGYEQEAA
jgi:hypothetical protein